MAPLRTLVLSNRSLLRQKYGEARFEAAVAPAVAAVAAAADARLVWIDDAADMQAVHGPPVPAHAHGARFTPAEHAAYKAAVDAACEALDPHYVALVGGPDVVPHQPLQNPALVPESADPDDDVPSDLPYACRAGYGTSAADFVGPERAVGRIPDVPGRHGGQYLPGFLAALAAAAADEALPDTEYRRALAISAARWETSTRAAIDGLLAPSTPLRLSPTEGWQWSADDMASRLHFINCHGSPNEQEFRGDGPAGRPVAHRGSHVANHAQPGTVVVAGCCYGAQLFDPTDGGGQPGIVFEYLHRGARCVFGSTTFAYGAPDGGSDYADVLCAAFVRHLLAGCSSGLAALRARTTYVEHARHARGLLDPLDLKTLAQFVLVGDPSAHPVLGPHAPPDAAPAADTLLELAPSDATLGARRAERRRRAAVDAAVLRATTLVAGDEIPEPPDATRERALAELAARLDLAVASVRRFALRVPEPAAPWTALAAAPDGEAPRAAYLIAARRRRPGGEEPVVVTAVEAGGRLIDVRVAHGKSPHGRSPHGRSPHGTSAG